MIKTLVKQMSKKDRKFSIITPSDYWRSNYGNHNSYAYGNFGLRSEFKIPI